MSIVRTDPYLLPLAVGLITLTKIDIECIAKRSRWLQRLDDM